MKSYKLILTAILGVSLFWACDPLEEEINEIKQNQSIEKTVEVRLDDDAYAYSSNESVAKYGNFNDVDQAKELIPEILDNLFPALGQGSSANVTYDIYQPLSLRDTIAETTVTYQEYQDLGFTYGNFDSDDDIDLYLKGKYPDANERDVVNLTYDWYAGSTSTITKAIVLWNGVWRNSYVLSADNGDYQNLDRGSRDYFSTKSQAENNIGIYLNELFPYAEAGQMEFVIYNYRDYDQDGIEYGQVLLYRYDGSSWNLKDSSNEEYSLKFAHNGTTWVADNTIKYSLTAEDYIAIAAAYQDSNSSGSESMNSYKNYDISLWTEEQIEESIINHMTELFPPVDGQKYLVEYATWEPGSGTGTLYIIGEGGTYVIYEAE